MRTAAPLTPNQSANFTTHRLARESDRWCYRPTPVARLLLASLSVLGWLCAEAGVLALGSSLAGGLLGVGAGAGLVLLGRRVGAQYQAGSVIDLRRRRIEVVARPRFAPGMPAAATVSLRFDQVTAVEILSKQVADADLDFLGHELNLVAGDGRRYNLVDHHDGELIASEARAIAGLLGVELRDFRAARPEGPVHSA